MKKPKPVVEERVQCCECRNSVPESQSIACDCSYFVCLECKTMHADHCPHAEEQGAADET